MIIFRYSNLRDRPKTMSTISKDPTKPKFPTFKKNSINRALHPLKIWKESEGGLKRLSEQIDKRRIVYFAGFGSSMRIAQDHRINDVYAACLNLFTGDMPPVIIYGGDPSNDQDPDIGYFVAELYYRSKGKIEIYAIQSESCRKYVGDGVSPAYGFLSGIMYFDDDLDSNGKTMYSGYRRANGALKPVGTIKRMMDLIRMRPYLYQESIFLGGGSIAADELHLIRCLGMKNTVHHVQPIIYITQPDRLETARRMLVDLIGDENADKINLDNLLTSGPVRVLDKLALRYVAEENPRLKSVDLTGMIAYSSSGLDCCPAEHRAKLNDDSILKCTGVDIYKFLKAGGYPLPLHIARYAPFTWEIPRIMAFAVFRKYDQCFNWDETYSYKPKLYKDERVINGFPVYVYVDSYEVHDCEKKLKGVTELRTLYRGDDEACAMLDQLVAKVSATPINCVEIVNCLDPVESTVSYEYIVKHKPIPATHGGFGRKFPTMDWDKMKP